MRHRTSRTSTASRGPAWAVGAFVVLCPQVLGGATPIAQLAISVLALLACTYVSFGLKGIRRNLGVPPVAGLAMMVVWVWSAIQVVAVPCSWVAWLAPDRASTVMEAHALANAGKALCTISAAPGATRAALPLSVGAAMCLFAGVALGRAGHREFLALAVAVSTLLMACVALAHTAFQSQTVFGIYAPQHSHPALLAPLLNENHLAGFMALGFPVCLALGLTSTRLDHRLLWLAGAFIVATVNLFTTSRGGAGALGLAGGAYLLAHFTRGSAERAIPWRRTTVAVGAILIAGSTYLGGDLIASQFARGGTDTSKISNTLEFSKLLPAYMWLGMGGGALGDLSPTLSALRGHAIWAENIAIEKALNWGLPVFFVTAALFGISLRRFRPAGRIDVAAACGLGALLVQNLVDFSLELPGIGFVAAVLLGSLLSSERPYSLPRDHANSLLNRISLRNALPASAACMAATLAFAGPTLTSESRQHLHSRLEASLRAGALDRTSALPRAVRHYPYDPVVALMAATDSVRSNSHHPLRALNLALALAPHWSASHIQAAYYLEKLERLDQAAVELSLAANANVNDASAQLCGFLHRHPAAELAFAAAASGSAREASLVAGLNCLWAFRPDEGEKLAKKILTEYPQLLSAQKVLVEAAVSQKRRDSAIVGAKELIRDHPRSPVAWSTNIRVLAQLDRPDLALEAYDRLLAPLRGDADVMQASAEAAVRAGDEHRLEQIISELLVRHGSTVEKRVRLEAFASNAFSRIGDSMQALARAQTAYELSGAPEMAELAYHAAVQAGITNVALKLASELCAVKHQARQFCESMSGIQR